MSHKDWERLFKELSCYEQLSQRTYKEEYRKDLMAKAASIIERIFNRWTKWEVFKEDQMYIRKQVNYITGWESEPTKVYCDVMKKTNKYTGMVKYKTVVKE